MPIDPQLAGLLEFLAASDHPKTYEGTVAQARQGYQALTVGTTAPEQVVALHEVRDLELPGAEGPRPARLYRPTEGDLPTTVYLHGGGYVIGDLDTHDQVCRRLARDCGTVVVAVDYRLAPEHAFPAGLEDAVTATRWVAEHRAELGGGDRVVVGGDSAGGNLSLGCALALPGTVDGLLLVYPAADSTTDYPSHIENGTGYFLEQPTIDWFGRHYLGGSEVPVDPADPRLSPLLSPGLAGLPTTLVVTAELDPLRDEGEELARRLEAAGVASEVVRYDGMIHGFVDMVGFSEGAAAAVADLHARAGRLLYA